VFCAGGGASRVDSDDVEDALAENSMEEPLASGSLSAAGSGGSSTGKRSAPAHLLPPGIKQVPGGLTSCPVFKGCVHFRSSTGTTEGHYHCALSVDGMPCTWSDSKRNRAVAHEASHSAKEARGELVLGSKCELGLQVLGAFTCFGCLLPNHSSALRVLGLTLTRSITMYFKLH
jgi:hypothetical protein